MTSKEFTIWLKGFTEGVHEYNITPKQWDLLKEKLEQVRDTEQIGTPIGEGGWGIPNTSPFRPYVDPYNPYKITCSSGSFGTSGYSQVITTTPGVSSITYANPPGTTTSTATSLPSGSTISYTTYQPFSTQTDNDLKSKKTKKK
jgi:hypothetical protein